MGLLNSSTGLEWRVPERSEGQERGGVWRSSSDEVREKFNQGTKAGNKKTKTMGRNRMEGILPEWRVRMMGQQRKYARRLADWLGRKTAKVPAARMRVYVMLCMAGIAAVNLLILLHAADVHPVALPVEVVRSQGLIFRIPPARGPDLVRFLDSLRADSVGGRLLDSLFRARPGLADTLRRLGEWVR